MDIFEIGERVRKERKLRNLSQEKLAEMAGVSRARINHLEQGSALEMKFGNVMNVLNALNLDMKMTDYNAGRSTFDELRDELDADPKKPDESDEPSF